MTLTFDPLMPHLIRLSNKYPNEVIMPINKQMYTFIQKISFSQDHLWRMYTTLNTQTAREQYASSPSR